MLFKDYEHIVIYMSVMVINYEWQATITAKVRIYAVD